MSYRFPLPLQRFLLPFLLCDAEVTPEADEPAPSENEGAPAGAAPNENPPGADTAPGAELPNVNPPVAAGVDAGAGAAP